MQTLLSKEIKMKQVISKLQELADSGAINRNAKRVPQNVSNRRGGGRNTPANQLKAVKSAVKKYLPLWKERFDEKRPCFKQNNSFIPC